MLKLRRGDSHNTLVVIKQVECVLVWMQGHLKSTECSKLEQLTMRLLNVCTKKQVVQMPYSPELSKVIMISVTSSATDGLLKGAL